MTPMQRLLKDLRNPLVKRSIEVFEVFEDSYVQLERAWLQARMYEAMDKRMEEVDEIIDRIYQK